MKHVFLPVCGVLIVSALLAGCRSKSPSNPSNPQQPFLSPASIFIPVGLLKSPTGVAVDASRDIWIADTDNNLIRRFTPEGVQRDSISGFTQPGFMGIDQLTGNVLCVAGGSVVVRITPGNNTAFIDFTIQASLIDGSSVFDINERQSVLKDVRFDFAGDLYGAPNGDTYIGIVNQLGLNYLLKEHNGFVQAVAFSSVASNVVSPRFVVIDGFGTVYTSFVLLTGGNPRAYAFDPSNLSLSHAISSPYITGGAAGAGIDPAGNVYVADAASGAITVFSSTGERTLDFVQVPDISGISQIAPRDIGVGPDGTIYVVVNDLFGSANQPGAVLKYTRN